MLSVVFSSSTKPRVYNKIKNKCFLPRPIFRSRKTKRKNTRKSMDSNNSNSNSMYLCILLCLCYAISLCIAWGCPGRIHSLCPETSGTSSDQLIYIFLCTGTVRGGLPSLPFSTALPSPPARQTQTTPATYIYIYIYVNPPSKDYCYYFYLQTLTKI